MRHITDIREERIPACKYSHTKSDCSLTLPSHRCETTANQRLGQPIHQGRLCLPWLAWGQRQAAERGILSRHQVLEAQANHQFVRGPGKGHRDLPIELWGNKVNLHQFSRWQSTATWFQEDCIPQVCWKSRHHGQESQHWNHWHLFQGDELRGFESGPKWWQRLDSIRIPWDHHQTSEGQILGDRQRV